MVETQFVALPLLSCDVRSPGISFLQYVVPQHSAVLSCKKGGQSAPARGKDMSLLCHSLGLLLPSYVLSKYGHQWTVTTKLRAIKAFSQDIERQLNAAPCCRSSRRIQPCDAVVHNGTIVLCGAKLWLTGVLAQLTEPSQSARCHNCSSHVTA